MANNLTLEDIDNLCLWYTRLEGNELESKEEILDIDYIKAKNSLPKEVFKLNSLKRLFIEVEDLTEIPKEIGNLSNLSDLIIRGCHNLKELPKEIGNLSNLTDLTIEDCPNLKELPKEYWNNWNKGATRNYRIYIDIKNGDNVELLKSTLDSAISNSANKILALHLRQFDDD